MGMEGFRKKLLASFFLSVFVFHLRETGNPSPKITKKEKFILTKVVSGLGGGNATRGGLRG